MRFFDDLICLLAGEVDTAPIAEIPEPLATAIGSQTHFVFLSHETVFKQRRRHPEVSAAHFMLLHDVLAYGLVLLEAGPPARLHFCYNRVEGERYVATVKSADEGRRMYVVRFHKIRKRQTKALIGRGRVLRRHKL